MDACIYYTGRLICLEPDQHVCTIVYCSSVQLVLYMYFKSCLTIH